MTAPTTSLADLLAECDAHDIRPLPDGNGGLIIDAPRGALAPDLLARMKAHKAELLALLQRTADEAPIGIATLTEALTNPVCRCGSTTFRDVPIHHGQSLRRDCAHCGRFIGFPFWHGSHYWT